METLGQLLQTGDWKGEKHVPVIQAPDSVKSGESFDIKVSIGEAIPHPNTLEHHISWVQVFFHGSGDKFPVLLASYDFAAHGEGDSYTEPVGITRIKLSKPGRIFAVSCCNIHGLWESYLDIAVE